MAVGRCTVVEFAESNDFALSAVNKRDCQTGVLPCIDALLRLVNHARRKQPNLLTSDWSARCSLLGQSGRLGGGQNEGDAKGLAPGRDARSRMVECVGLHSSCKYCASRRELQRNHF